MDETKDPILPESESVQLPDEEKTILNIGYEGIKKSREDVKDIGEKLNLVFTNEASARNGVTFLEGAMFALGSRDRGNIEWREHCASSLRELIHEWKDAGRISTAFNKTFAQNDSGFPNMKTHAQDYRKLQEYYNYFSCICHHNTVDTILHLRNLYNSDMKAGDDNAEMFLKVVKDFLSDLRSFFKEHVKENES